VTDGPDPFAIDEARWLEALNREWNRIYLISPNGGTWYATRRDGTGDAIIADSPGELNAAMHRNAR